MCVSTSSAQSATACSDASACIPPEYKRACDAYPVALRACQRDLDASAGALAERRRQVEDALTGHAVARARLERRVAELEARPGAWTWVLIGAGTSAAIITLAAFALR